MLPARAAPLRSAPCRAVPCRAGGANSLTTPPWLGPGWSSLKGPGRGELAAGRGCGHGPAPRAPHGAAPCNRPYGRATPERWDRRDVRTLPSQPTPSYAPCCGRRAAHGPAHPHPRVSPPGHARSAHAPHTRSRPALLWGWVGRGQGPLELSALTDPTATGGHKEPSPLSGPPQRRLSGTPHTDSGLGCSEACSEGPAADILPREREGELNGTTGLTAGRRGLSLTYRDRLL